MIAYMAYEDNSSIKKVASFILDGGHKSWKTVRKGNPEISSLQTILPAFKKAKKCLIHIGQQTIDQLQMDVLNVLCQTQTTFHRNPADKNNFIIK